MAYNQAVIDNIIKDPNTKAISDKELLKLFTDGIFAGKEDEIMSKLKEPRLSRVKAALGGVQDDKIRQAEYNNLINGIGVTEADMEAFIKKYPSTPEAKIIQDKLDAKRHMAEETEWTACSTLADYQRFADKYSWSVHYADAQVKIVDLRAKIMQEDHEAWNSTDKNSLEDVKKYVENENYTAHQTEALAILEVLQKKRMEEEDEQAWLLALASHDVQMLQDYMQRYTRHKEEAENEIRVLKNRPLIEAEIQRVLDDPMSDVDNYVFLMRKYPSFATEIRAWMLEDMGRNPWRYQRDEMYALLYGGPLSFSDKNGTSEVIAPIFTRNEILQTGLMTERQLVWLNAHKTIEMDFINQPALPVEKDFGVEPHCTDVYFFGVPGSGKTSVLAGLFKAARLTDDLTFRLLMQNCRHMGFNYANVLVRALENNLFPQSTPKVVQRLGEITGDASNDDKFIQVIDAEITERQKDQFKHHKVSLIEMPGERTNQLAAVKGLDVDLLGRGARELLSNDNNKVIFFVIDPFSTREQSVMLNGSPVSLSQAETINAVAMLVKSLLEKEQIKNLKAVHVIMAKSDMLPDTSFATLSQKMREEGYQRFANTLQEICAKNLGEVNMHCGRQPHVFTFSLGKVAPGDFVVYDQTDTNKILQVICANTASVRTRNFLDTVWDSLNKSIF